MFDIKVSVLSILEKSRGITAHGITLKINSRAVIGKVNRQDVSKALQSLKRSGLALNNGSVWNNNY